MIDDSVAVVSFPNLTMKVDFADSEFAEFGGHPCGFKVFEKKGKFVINYTAADVGFAGDSIKEVADNLTAWLKADEWVRRVGKPVIKER